MQCRGFEVVLVEFGDTVALRTPMHRGRRHDAAVTRPRGSRVTCGRPCWSSKRLS